MQDSGEELAKFSTCDVADGLLNLHSIVDGGYFPNLTQYSQRSKVSVVGRAYTVLFAPVDDPRPAVNYIDAISKGCFLVIALSKELQTPYAPYVKVTQACYGGLMSTRAKYQGAVGSVIFGRVRDIEEHRALEYPVFSYGLGACAPKMAIKPVAINVPLEILCIDGADKIIKPADYIVGDEHGVVRIPGDMDMAALLEYMKTSVEADELVVQDINAGVPAKQAQKERREVLQRFL
ncbi:hypothetical protein HG536_0F03390 [Torulaspora globosa]|uniref:4-hydroxy-4-methyl-2-oxoglutarate aldolase n=1 Tax=Torulaspora globosa TaxID=48254 RepID=A0A7G3ZKH8_9SACH|nr:uncharacterized protein HG536_0F03390 [Torulaspora globosa]QLL34014.1 hypothetical protein HG536_0F03390 [Torulaspora globosa]